MLKALISKINRKTQFLRNCILNFQFEQVDKCIDNICEFTLSLQLFMSFAIVLLYKFFYTLPERIKLKPNPVPSSNLENESPYNITIQLFNKYTDNIPFFRKRIVVDLFFLRI